MTQYRTLLRGVAGQQHELVTPLREGEKERQKNRAQHDPGGDLDVDRRAAGQHPQHESEADHHDVEDDHLLEAEGVEEVEDQIGGEDAEKLASEETRPQPARDQQRQQRNRRGTHAQGAGGQRPVALQGMAAILLAVADVVEQVHCARRQAEAREGDQRPREAAGVEDSLGKDQRGQHEDVLGPLVWPHGDPQRGRHGRYSTGR